jgi:EF-hand domain pair
VLAFLLSFCFDISFFLIDFFLSSFQRTFRLLARFSGHLGLADVANTFGAHDARILPTYGGENVKKIAARMGANPCKELGIQDREIGSKDLLELWDKYDKDGNGKLDRAEALAFLKDFGKAIGVKIEPDNAERYLTEHCDNDGTLSQDQFLSMFAAVASESGATRKMELTSSMQVRVDKALEDRAEELMTQAEAEEQARLEEMKRAREMRESMDKKPMRMRPKK